MAMQLNKQLPLPADLKAEYPLSGEITGVKARRDAEIRDIFTGRSDKFVVIVGPCSADNEDAVCDYVSRLASLNDRLSDRLMLIPRIYTNKPRTTGEGYKGMLHQPEPDKAPDLLAGIIAILCIMTLGAGSPALGDTFAVKAIILMLFAGMGNLKGGLLSALFMGVVEAMALAYLPGRWTEAVFYGVIMLVIIWKPNGLFGKQH